MHKHEHLILKSHNLGHLEIGVNIFYLKRIWKKKKKKVPNVFVRMSKLQRLIPLIDFSARRQKSVTFTLNVLQTT